MTAVVFLGTPDAARPTLSALHHGFEVKAVITRPDRPRGRSRQPIPPPVKTLANELGLSLEQPVTRAELDAVLDSLRPFDVAVVVAYGQILSPTALTTASRGFLNVHFSLLPRWRGAAPVARALMAGDKMTGVTIIELDEGLDTGPVLTAQGIDIGHDEDAGALTARLGEIGSRLLVRSLPGYLNGTLVPIEQVDEGASYASMIVPDDRKLTSALSVDEFLGRVRGLAPKPGAHLDIDGTQTIVLHALPLPETPVPGTWELVDGWPVAGLADGGVRLVSVHPEGKRPMSGDAWARGRASESGVIGS